MADEPPQRFKHRVVKTETLRAILVKRLAEVGEEMAASNRKHWPDGTLVFEPKPGETNTALHQTSMARALDDAGKIIDELREWHPGYGEAD